MKGCLFLLLFFVYVTCSTVPVGTDLANARRLKYEAIKKQKQQDKLLQEARSDSPVELEQAEIEEELRERLGGQKGVDAAKMKLADYIKSVGGEEGIRARVEKYGLEMVQKEIHLAVHGDLPPDNTMIHLGIVVAAIVLLALPFTRDEIVWMLTQIQGLFAIDQRGILCFRVCLGLLVAGDALQRLTEADAFYSQSGVYPRELAFEDQGEFAWSLYFANGHIYWAYLLLVCTALSGLSLAVGMFPRLASIVAWVLLTSLHVRNPHICNAGDTLLSIFLLWASFLPLSELLSVDNYAINRYKPYSAAITSTTITDIAATTTTVPLNVNNINTHANVISSTPVQVTNNNKKKHHAKNVNENKSQNVQKEIVVVPSVVTPVIVGPNYMFGSLAVLGIFLQLAWFYLFSDQSRSSPGWSPREDFSAFYYLLSASTLTHPSAATIIRLAHDAHWSRVVLSLLRGATMGIMILQRWGVILFLLAPLLTLISSRLNGLRDGIRCGVLVAYTVLNLGLLFTLKLGLLPFVLLVAQTLFLPSFVYDFIGSRIPIPTASMKWAWRRYTTEERLATASTTVSSPLGVGISPEQLSGNGAVATPLTTSSEVCVDQRSVHLRPHNWLSRVMCLMLLAHTAWLNFADDGSETHERLQDVMGHRQMWHIFPEIESDSYLVIPAKLRGHSEQFDLQQAFGRREVKVGFFPLVHLDSLRPVLSAPFYDSFRWTSFMALEDSPSRMRQLAMYICKEWNKVNRGPGSLESLEFHWVSVAIKQPKNPLTGAKKVLEGSTRFFDHTCEF